MTRVVIIGGGIAGLSVALAATRAGADVTLFEAAAQTGGQLRTLREGGFVIEEGAEGFVASSQVMEDLATELGIAASLCGQLTERSYGFDGRELVALGPGEAAQFLGFQVPRRDLGKGIRAFSRGMGEVIEAMVRALGAPVDLRVGRRVERLIRAGSHWSITSEGETVAADRVVVATGARAAAALLTAEFGGVAAELAHAEALSSVTVSLAYARPSIAHELDGTGFVVAEEAQAEGFRACTFTSSKLPERAPPGHALLRAFFRPSDEELERLVEADWAARAERGIARVLAPTERPERAWVSRWRAALPVFDATQRDRVAALEAALFGSNVLLAGAAFHGSGIDAAVRSARRASALVV